MRIEYLLLLILDTMNEYQGNYWEDEDEYDVISNGEDNGQTVED
jgi:hypothetical protein